MHSLGFALGADTEAATAAHCNGVEEINAEVKEKGKVGCLTKIHAHVRAQRGRFGKGTRILWIITTSQRQIQLSERISEKVNWEPRCFDIFSGYQIANG